MSSTQVGQHEAVGEAHHPEDVARHPRRGGRGPRTRTPRSRGRGPRPRPLPSARQRSIPARSRAVPRPSPCRSAATAMPRSCRAGWTPDGRALPLQEGDDAHRRAVVVDRGRGGTFPLVVAREDDVGVGPPVPQDRPAQVVRASTGRPRGCGSGRGGGETGPGRVCSRMRARRSGDLVAMAAGDDLQPDGQAVGGQAGRHRDGRVPAEVGQHRERRGHGRPRPPGRRPPSAAGPSAANAGIAVVGVSRTSISSNSAAACSVSVLPAPLDVGEPGDDPVLGLLQALTGVER